MIVYVIPSITSLYFLLSYAVCLTTKNFSASSITAVVTNAIMKKYTHLFMDEGMRASALISIPAAMIVVRTPQKNTLFLSLRGSFSPLSCFSKNHNKKSAGSTDIKSKRIIRKTSCMVCILAVKATLRELICTVSALEKCTDLCYN